MGLIESSTKQRMFLGISKGKITRRLPNGEGVETYNGFEGHLKGLNERRATVNGADTVFVDFIFQDGDTEYNLSVQLASSVARGIILSLASIKDFSGNMIKVSPWLSKDGAYTNISVYNKNEKVGWVTDKIPALKEIHAGSNVYKDDSDRIEFIRGYIASIQAALAATNGGTQEDGPAPDDLPGDEGEGGFFGNEAPEHL